MHKPSDRYIKLVEWSDEDGCYVGRCPGLFLGGVHGDDEAKVYKDLCKVVDEHLADLNAARKPAPKAPRRPKPSGRILLRIDPGLHESLALRALAEGVSLNELCAKTLAHV